MKHLGIVFIALVPLLWAPTAQAYTLTSTRITSLTTVKTNNSLLGTLSGGGGTNVTGSSGAIRHTPWYEAKPSYKGRLYNYTYGGTYTYNTTQTVNINGKNVVKPARQISFVWGSPDASNIFEILKNGVVIKSFSTSASYVAATPNAVNVSSLIPRINGSSSYIFTVSTLLAGERFDQVRFRAPGGTFEFADVTFTPVPVPPAFFMLGTALFGLGMLTRRRQKTL